MSPPTRSCRPVLACSRTAATSLRWPTLPSTSSTRPTRSGHAAIVPRYLGLRAVLAKSIARIHGQNLVNFAVLPLTFTDPGDHDRIDQGDALAIDEPAAQLRRGDRVEVVNETKGETYVMRHRLTPRQVEIVARGSLISVIRDRERA